MYDKIHYKLKKKKKKNVGVLEVWKNIKKLVFVKLHPWCFKMICLKLLSIMKLMNCILQMTGLLPSYWNFTLLRH